MANEPTTFGLGWDKLARLWDIQEKDTASAKDENQYRVELLHDRLAAKMPLEQAVAQALPQVFAQLCREVKPFTADSLRALIVNSDTDVSVLKKIKNYNKKLSDRLQSEAEHDVIAVLYYATIASALVYHDQRITSFSYDHLATQYAELKTKSWLTSDLRSLLEQAHQVCKQKCTPKE